MRHQPDGVVETPEPSRALIGTRGVFAVLTVAALTLALVALSCISWGVVAPRAGSARVAVSIVAYVAALGVAVGANRLAWTGVRTARRAADILRANMPVLALVVVAVGLAAVPYLVIPGV